MADGANVSNVNVTHNVIENLNAIGAAAANKGIQWHDDYGDYALVDSMIAYNVIDNVVSANKGGYGVQTVGSLDNVDIKYNTISNIDGAWGAGIALDDNTESTLTTDVVVMRNQVTDSIWSNVSVQVEHNVDQTGIVINENNLLFLVHGSGVAATGPEVNAESNWWGDLDPSDNVFGPVDYIPFEVAAFPS